ncbi:para-aminobenzoate synthetase component I [Methylacidimicrobium cyclopophantes]|uniref:Para-aminobenzoate synthetase component I n=1 Tax=Methylacidimicrobium cyclopophantes TaxID=1041766 RepID=A0A5E6MAV9_9BACT|nr:anthranilate synthase component I family protein [Methylacidimicrobium cyclopophantes]VVM06348.1 para-aminobenzoate synthetase component I [Methylacidimicrobium cyclopophantes]
MVSSASREGRPSDSDPSHGYGFVPLWGEHGGYLVGEEPEEIIRGDLPEWRRLRAAYLENAGPGGPPPPGGLMGTVSFEGAFRFGIYRRWHGSVAPWREESWQKRRSEARPRPRHLPPASFRTGREEFVSMVREAQEYIRSGDIYVVNLARRLLWQLSADPFLLWECLLGRDRPPGSGFLRTESGWLLSASPELFLRISGEQIETRPIKGTIPRSEGAEADSLIRLQANPKERAELLMVTDVERNDLGQICRFGTIRVDRFAAATRHAHLWHLFSSVKGILRPEIDPVTALFACLPGGSITGAPKRRAAEILSLLEPEPRGLYTGVFGYISFSGEAAFTMTIRSLEMAAETVSLSVGSGITIDSNPEAEYEETCLKAKAWEEALRSYTGG